MPNTGELEKYRLLWAIMWPVGMALMSEHSQHRGSHAEHHCDGKRT